MLTDLTIPKQYAAKYASLDEEFAGFKPLMEDVGDYILPRRGKFDNNTKPQGSQFAGRHDLILDSHATRANRTLGAGMQGGLVSPSRPWFNLSLFDEELSESGPVRRWMDEAKKVMYKVFQKSNFYNQIHTVFEEEAGFGTAAIFAEEDFESVVNFVVFTAGTYRISVGKNGMVDTVGRAIWMQAKQMIEKFGEDNVSDNVKEAMKENPYKWFKVLHFIEPREGRDITKIDNKNMPWKSIYVDVDGDLVLSESGFETAAHAVPRWNTVGNWAYGLGPGADVRGAVKMLQEMQKTVIMALHKEINPPLAVPSKFKGVLSLIPGAVNPIDQQNNDKIGPLYQVQLNITNVQRYIEAIHDSISKDYYNDLFLMIAAADKGMTATEVVERHEEKLLLLGPTIERQERELLNPILDRVFTMCLNRGLFPEFPPELEGKEIKFEYVSLLAQAQQLITAQSINTHMTLMERVAQFDPNSVKATTDFIEMLSEHARVVGMPADIVRTSKEAEEYLAGIQAAEKKAAEQQQALEAAKVGAATPGDQSAQLENLSQQLGV